MEILLSVYQNNFFKTKMYISIQKNFSKKI